MLGPLLEVLSVAMVEGVCRGEAVVDDEAWGEVVEKREVERKTHTAQGCDS
jgi:hypothetical protein